MTIRVCAHHFCPADADAVPGGGKLTHSSHLPRDPLCAPSFRVRGPGWIALVMLLAVGCPGSIEDPDRFGSGPGGGGGGGGGDGFVCSVQAGGDIEALLTDAEGCAAGGCHATGVSFPDLSSAQALANLVDLPSQKCTGAGEPDRRVIDPADLDRSILLLSVGMDGDRCGVIQMPLGAEPLSDDQQTCLREFMTYLVSESAGQ